MIRPQVLRHQAKSAILEIICCVAHLYTGKPDHRAPPQQCLRRHFSRVCRSLVHPNETAQIIHDCLSLGIDIPASQHILCPTVHQHRREERQNVQPYQPTHHEQPPLVYCVCTSATLCSVPRHFCCTLCCPSIATFQESFRDISICVFCRVLSFELLIEQEQTNTIRPLRSLPTARVDKAGEGGSSTRQGGASQGSCVVSR